MLTTATHNACVFRAKVATDSGRTRFKKRFGGGGKRLRHIGIVAVARKLLIALWRFLETRVLPEGAVLKEA